MSRVGPRSQRHLDQPDRIRRVAGPDDDHQIAFRGHRLDRALAVLGGVADVVAGRVLQSREPLPQLGDGLQRLVDAEGGLRQPDDFALVAHGHAVDTLGAVDQLDVIGRLAGGADDLFVALVPDQQDVVVLPGEPLGLVVHLGHQRAGRVDHLQIAGGRRLVHGRGHTMRGEDHDGALGHLVGLVDEDRAALGQCLDDVAVVHDLVTHVDRRPMFLQGELDGFDGAVHTRAVTTRLGEQHPLATAVRGRTGGTRYPHVDGWRHGISVRSPRCGTGQTVRWCPWHKHRTGSACWSAWP